MRTGMARYLPELSTSKHCIAYLDVLGAKDFMRSESHKFLNDLNSIYLDAQDEVIGMRKFTGIPVSAKIFSDNIVLFIPLRDDADSTKENVEHIVSLAGSLYNVALIHGYLLRGAITIGEFYANERFVYGKALLEAVEMEEKYAIYPRIIAQKEVSDFIPQYFCECFDGYFALCNFRLNGNLDLFKHWLLEICKRDGHNKTVMQKIMWAIHSFNIHNEHHPGIKRKITKQEIANAVVNVGKDTTVQDEKEVGE